MGLRTMLLPITTVEQFEKDFDVLLNLAALIDHRRMTNTLSIRAAINALAQVVKQADHSDPPEFIKEMFSMALYAIFMEFERVTKLGGDILIKHCSNLLLVKGKEYTRSNDRLELFKKAITYAVVSTPAQVAWMFGCKQFTSLMDFISDHDQGKDVPKDVWFEKFGDCANYIWLVWSAYAESYGRDRLGIPILPIITAQQAQPISAIEDQYRA